MVAATHEHDFLHPLHNARLLAGSHGNVCERTGGHQGHGTRLLGHDGVDNEIHGMPICQVKRGLRQLIVVDFHAHITVNIGGHFHVTYQGSGAASMHGHIGDTGNSAHHPGVSGHLLQGLITTNRCDSQHFNAGITQGQEDSNGIIVARVAIKNDSLCGCHASIFIFSSASRASRAATVSSMVSGFGMSIDVQNAIAAMMAPAMMPAA